MLNGLSSVLDIKSLIFASAKTEIAHRYVTLAVKCDTSRLPQCFREKFRIGTYKIDESHGDIRIGSLGMDLKDQKKILEAIRKENALPRLCDIAKLNFRRSKENIEAFWRDFTDHHRHTIAIYLEIGGGTYFYPDLFERLIIAQNGCIIEDLRHGYRGPCGLVKDDHNIQKKLWESAALSEAFQRGTAKIFVYHKLCKSITSLYFDLHDEHVAQLDSKRALFFKSKHYLWAITQITFFYALWSASHDIPILGYIFSPLVISLGIGSLFYLFLPKDIRATFWRKIKESFPFGERVQGWIGKWKTCQSKK
ncbi:MAG: hypothetical protein LBB11_04265 [Puniceicoccales bacterium]|jgi:hypothetical protein|nr:hypothetical protein [Puniceicoccales bacterium]